jgi:hypothetical protein
MKIDLLRSFTIEKILVLDRRLVSLDPMYNSNDLSVDTLKELSTEDLQQISSDLIELVRIVFAGGRR